MFEQTFKNIDDILHKDAGCTSELDYTEQSSWLLFLKYLDALEADKAAEAALEGKRHSLILAAPYRWGTWAAPKLVNGELDHNAALTGDDLRGFVNNELFPYLAGFKQRASGPNTIEYKIGEVFGEIKNKVQSGYNLRDVIALVDELRFGSQSEKHELSHLYEAKIRNMGNAGRNGGEYYTPRPLIRAMIQVLQPKIGERIYDGACGSAGFLCEAFEHLSRQPGLSTADLHTLQTRSFYGKEKKSLAYVIAIMNMILHGIEAPNIVHANTLAENISDIQEKDRYDIVLANPPFGGKERKEVQQNFPIKTGETAFLFLQHFVKSLRAGGRAAIVIKNTFLSNTDSASISLRKLLLQSCNLHTVLDMPGGTFQGAGVKTVVLFFEKGAPTRQVWYYRLNPGRNLGKTNPLNDDDLADFVAQQQSFATTANSWVVAAEGIDAATFDLSAKNPDGGDEVALRSPQDILDEIAALDAESAEVMATIKAGSSAPLPFFPGCTRRTLEEAVESNCSLSYGIVQPGEEQADGLPIVRPVDLVSRVISLEGLKRINPDLAKSYARTTLVGGDLLLCVRGTTGTVAVAAPELAGANVTRGIVPIRFSPSLVSQQLGYYLLRSEAVQAQIRAKTYGTALMQINIGDLRRLALTIPPLAQQADIVARLDASEAAGQRLESIYEQKLAALDELKKSLLHQAFSGGLTDKRADTLLATSP